MTAPVTTTIDMLYDAILTTLRGTYAELFVTYAPYDPMTLLDATVQLAVPALYLEIEDQVTDDETARRALRQRTAIRLSISLWVILSIETVDIQVALSVLASSLLVLLRQPDPDPRLGGHPGARWGLGAAVHPATRVTVLMTNWQPGLNGYGARQIRWEQDIYLPTDPLECLGEDGPWRPLGGES